MDKLTLDALKTAVSGEFAGIRRVTRLEPQGEKVFPPTYEGGEYAEETRVIRNSTDIPKGTSIQSVETVLLDSVQSQANRMELALLRAYDRGEVKMPLLLTNFANAGADAILQDIGRITALEAPHRMCDAIFRDSLHDGQPFRSSGPGAKLNAAKATNATPVLELCPTALLFGFWDSAGPRGGLGAKVQRALVSEIVGYETKTGKRPASRIDPLQIEKIDTDEQIYAREGGGWTFDKESAQKDDKGVPITKDPSHVNHGNIVPSLWHDQKKDGKKTGKKVLNHGGVTLAYAIQHTVLSLAALRRLQFPVNGASSAEADLAARTLLAALGLAAICYLDEDGYDLRSRCLLDGKPGVFEFVGRGETRPFKLDGPAASSLLATAAKEADKFNLPWPEEPVKLLPSPDLCRLVIKSRQRTMAASTVE